LAAALCVALDEDFTLEEGCELLKKNFKLPRGRASLIEGKNGSMIIDSSYNASPTPMLDMLELLEKVPAKRKLALLGDMRELGDESDETHERVIAKALEICYQAYFIGPSMRKNMLSGGIWCNNAAEAAESIKLEEGDVLLVKGSQNTLFLETAVEKLMIHPEQADKLLCRRGEFWDKQRAK
jgi:UDP-N-acetylmuramoyl-tripeptide--D-alanyl-D-alanine ligase